VTRVLTIVLCFYNEEQWIARTLASLATQTDRRFSLILVDNGSTDGSVAAARSALKGMADIDARFISEPVAGKIHALRAGTMAAGTRYVATIDADTIYPPHYTATLLAMFARRPDASCAIGFGLPPNGVDGWTHRKLRFFAWALPRKCHSGGYAQAFDTARLMASGGFDAKRWPYVLEDHEIVNAIAKSGPILYHRDLYCFPSDRRSDRSAVGWTLAERIAYKLLPVAVMDRFFYNFLAGRFLRRGAANVALRNQDQWNRAD
jgi:glycosyltransferase involved in cell wall biosynthesis